MMIIEDRTLIHLKKRFVSDYNLPIQVLHEPYFTYYLQLYEDTHKTLSKWTSLLEMIKKDFNNNVQNWLNYYGEVRDRIITDIEKMPEYIDFSRVYDMNRYNIPNICGDYNIYNIDCKGHILLSIDLKKANFQALKYHDSKLVFDCNTYSEFIGLYSPYEYIKESKYTRQVIFGKLNASRQTKIEKYIMFEIYNNLDIIKVIESNGGKLISFKTDEIIFDVTEFNNTVLLTDLLNVKVNLPFDIRIEVFKLELMQFKTHTDSNINVWRKIFIDGHEELKSAPMTYYPQIYKAWKGIELDEKDLVFFHENQLAKFLNPITIDA